MNQMTTTRTPKLRARFEHIALPSLLVLAMSAQAQEKPKAAVPATMKFRRSSSPVRVLRVPSLID
jgi:hypothetical protein